MATFEDYVLAALTGACTPSAAEVAPVDVAAKYAFACGKYAAEMVCAKNGHAEGTTGRCPRCLKNFGAGAR